MTVDLTDEEATAIIESLRWSVHNIENSKHNDPDKPNRVAAIKEIERSVRRKIREAGR
jgi:hypothetical protein